MAEPTLGSKGAEHFGQHTRFQYRSVCVTPPPPQVKKLGGPSHSVAHALSVGPGGRRRWFQEPGGGPIVPMACLTLRNDHLLLELCPELKNASFETHLVAHAECGSPCVS